LATLTFGTFVFDRPSRFNPFDRRNRILRCNQGIGQFPTIVITHTIPTFGINGTKRFDVKFGIFSRSHIKIPLRKNRCNRHFRFPFALSFLVSRFNSSIKRRCKKSNGIFREPGQGQGREPGQGQGREPRAASREPRAASREPRAASREPRAGWGSQGQGREPRAGWGSQGQGREPGGEGRGGAAGGVGRRAGGGREPGGAASRVGPRAGWGREPGGAASRV